MAKTKITFKNGKLVEVPDDSALVSTTGRGTAVATPPSSPIKGGNLSIDPGILKGLTLPSTQVPGARSPLSVSGGSQDERTRVAESIARASAPTAPVDIDELRRKNQARQAEILAGRAPATTLPSPQVLGVGGIQQPDTQQQITAVQSQIIQKQQELAKAREAEAAGTVPAAPVETAKDKIIRSLAETLEKQRSQPSLTEEKARLEKERGVGKLKESVGSFEEEIAKTQQLLDQLEGDITKRTGEFLVSEEQRRRILASERQPLTKELSTLERGFATVSSRLATEQQDILAELGLIGEEQKEPLETLGTEIGLTKDIESLFAPSMQEVDTFTDEKGDRISVFYDEKTGKTQTMNLGKIGVDVKTEVVEAGGNKLLINSETGETIKNLGAAKGAEGAAAKPTTPQEEQKILKSRIDALPAGQQDGAYGAIASFKNARDIMGLLDQGVSTGPVAGVAGLAGQKLGTASELFNQFSASATAFTANYIKALSGVQVSDKERQFLLKALPSPTNQENVNRANLGELMKFLKNKFELQLGLNFADFPTEIPQIGGTEGGSDPLGLFE